MKIPMTELAFIKGQREKTSSIGPHQIDLLDLPEHNRQVKKAEAAEDERRGLAQYKQRITQND